MELEHILQRLAVLEAREEIRELKFRYFRACDHQKPDEVAACFAPGRVVIDYQEFPKFDTRESFAQIFGQMGCVPQVVDIHHGQNPVITLTGTDSAEGIWDIFYFNINLADRSCLQLAGVYHDLYVQIDGAWVMTSTIFRRTSILTHTIGEDGSVKCTGMGRSTARAPGENWAA